MSSRISENESPWSPPPKVAGIKAAFSYPPGAYFCLRAEFTERFSFYGMQAISIIYLINVHGLSASDAKLVYHTFAFTVFFTPLFLGAILADGYLGRYRVILFGSVSYCIGHVLLSIGAVPPLGLQLMEVLDFAGLFIVALASGGIEYCVMAFAADQFSPDKEPQRIQFFSFFCLIMSVGSLLSKVITPIIRRQSCMGQDTCYPLAFALPAIFMVLATLIFCSGTRFYRLIPISDNTAIRMAKCVFYALKRKFRSDEKKKSLVGLRIA